MSNTEEVRNSEIGGTEQAFVPVDKLVKERPPKKEVSEAARLGRKKASHISGLAPQFDLIRAGFEENPTPIEDGMVAILDFTDKHDELVELADSDEEAQVLKSRIRGRLAATGQRAKRYYPEEEGWVIKVRYPKLYVWYDAAGEQAKIDTKNAMRADEGAARERAW